MKEILNKNILIIDDEIDICEVLEFHFEDNGFNVITKNTSEDALKVINSDVKIDCIISDFRMPKMNGLELFQSTKNSKVSPFIIITGASDVSADEMLSVGISSVLHKPIEFPDLLAAVTGLL